MQESTFLLDGELKVNSLGIYTFVHYYKHLKTGRKVIITGMSHDGDKSYFQRVEQILSKCDLVLFEDMSSPDKPETADKPIDLNQLLREKPDAAFLTAMGMYFIQAFKAQNLAKEAQAFNYQKPNWILGDVSLSKKEEQASQSKLILGIQSISYQRKKEVVDYISKAIAKMTQNKFTRRNFGQGIAFIYSDPVIVQVLTKIIAEPRDKYLFKQFDSLIEKKNPRTIGIKFGAAHVSFLRYLLEKRGYIRQAKKKLSCIKF